MFYNNFSYKNSHNMPHFQKKVKNYIARDK